MTFGDQLMTAGITLHCPRCERQFAPGGQTRCLEHDEPAVLELSYDIDAMRDQFDPDFSGSSLWRYRELLPVDGTSPVTLGEGWTDLVAAPTTGAALGVDLSLKLEGNNPTGSAKDRGSTVVATRAQNQECTGVICASTGNAAASIAAYAARGNLDCSLFVPERLPEAKAIQPRVYGADLITVEGSYSDAYEACREHGVESEDTDRSAGTNPYIPAGTQTLGFELAEQAASPDWIAISMGNGGTIADLWQGWRLFERLGYTDGSPQLLGVQAETAATIQDGSGNETETGDTCADSIDVDEPHRKADAREAIADSGGTAVAVSDESIHESLRLLGSNEGVFAEPASAAAVAGVRQARQQGTIDAGERVVAVITGNGLKDTATAARTLE